MNDLNEIRKKIDEADREIIKLLEKRVDLSKYVALDKIKTGKKIYDKDREQKKIDSVKNFVTDKKNAPDIEKLYEQIMSGSRKIQYRILEENGRSMLFPYDKVDTLKKPGLKVAYQGIAGAYSHIALRKYFFDKEAGVSEKNLTEIPTRTWRQAMLKVVSGEADYAVLPIENSTAGSVTQVYDLLNEFPVYIAAEVYLQVRHSLLTIPGSVMADIKEVYSHPQAIAQCETFLLEHPDWTIKETLNTAVAADMVKKKGSKECAAIASKETADIYELTPIAEGINDKGENTTRFVIISSKRAFLKDAGRVSVVFETLNENGALFNMLSPIQYNNLGMLKIESRPMRDVNWNSRFFLDFEGNLSDERVRDTLRGMYEESTSFRLLGNY